MSLPDPMVLPGAAKPTAPTHDAWWKAPVNLWWRSLPLRVIASVFLASVLVLVLGGFLLMQQATSGVITFPDARRVSVAKRDASHLVA